MNLVFSTRLPRIGLAALTLIGAAIAAPQFANASVATITFGAPTITDNISGPVTTSDSTGYFDVTLTDSAAGDSLAAFQASLSLNAGATGIQFTAVDLGQLSNPYNTIPDGIGDAAGASPNLVDTYVFVGNSSTVTDGGLPYGGNVDAPDVTDADASDETNTGLVALTQNAVYSLEQVYYDIPIGTPVGTYALTLDQNTQTVDPGGDFVNLISNINTIELTPGAGINGAIIVNQIPEPTSVVLMMLGAIGLIGLGVRRARRA